MLKLSSPWAHAAEVAGLGILAKPSIDEMRGKKVPTKRKAGTELAGLGVLAAPSALSLGKHFLTKHAMAAFADELAKIAAMNRGFVRPIAAAAQQALKIKTPASFVRGKPFTGLPVK
jgi:hypothetical protein